MENPKKFWRFATLIFGIALLTRLSVLLYFWPEWIWQGGEVHDGWNKLAINFVDSGTFGFIQNEPTLTRGPLFPIFEIPLYLLFGEKYHLWSITFLLFDSCTCLLIMLLARKLWSNRAALLAGFFYAIHLAVIYYTAQIEQFTIALPLVFLLVYLFSVWDMRSPPNWLPWALGVVSGLLILNKSVYLLFPFVGIAFVTWSRRNRAPLKSSFKHTLIVLFVTALVVCPWTYRNYKISGGRFIPVQSLFWYTFWADIHWDELDKTQGMDRPAGKHWDYILMKGDSLLSIEENLSSQELSIPQKELYEERVFKKASLEWVSKDPYIFFRKVARNSWQFWFGAENLKKTILFFILQMGFLGAAGAGIRVLFRYRQLGQIKIGLVLILALWGEHCIVYAMGRHSLDLVPILGVIFGLGVDVWLNQNQRKDRVTPYRILNKETTS